jgi:hypothetical protein
VAESIAHGLSCNAVDFVPEDRVESPRRAFHLHLKDRRILVCISGPEFFSENPYGRDKVVGFDRGGAQALYSIPTLIDRLIRPINRDLKRFSSFNWTPWEQVDTSLKMEHQALKALQQRIVKFPRDAQALAHSCFQSESELAMYLVKTQLVKGPKQSERSSDAQESEPRRLVVRREDRKLQ